MAEEENGQKPAVTGEINNVTKPKDYCGWVMPLLRLLAFGAIISATLVMALNKQEKSFVFATIEFCILEMVPQFTAYTVYERTKPQIHDLALTSISNFTSKTTAHDTSQTVVELYVDTQIPNSISSIVPDASHAIMNATEETQCADAITAITRRDNRDGDDVAHKGSGHGHRYDIGVMA
ncbi:putative protein LSD1-like isoform X1 [Capsicum annuum]|nr:putative protein LSD1-like isoform X1 [Capsicum annuum]